MPEESLRLFFSYSHKDEALRDELAKHLTILEWQGVISSWHDRKILPGEEWDYQINDNLNTADIILLLVSSDFLFSKYCWDVEVKKAIERHHAGKACVIPVILRSVDWNGAPFGKLQALPKNAEPIVSRNWHNLDEAFTDVARGIRVVAEKLKKERPCKQEQANLLGQETAIRILKEKIDRRRQKPQSTKTTTAKLTQETDNFLSEKGVDYRRLRDLLKAGNWKQADRETLAVMLKASGRESEGWLDSESIDNFPCTDLRTIDQLWVEYSNGHFGLSVQKQIWESVEKDYEKFGDRVGWRKGMLFNQEWLSDLELTFTTNSPQGHLPVAVNWWGRSWQLSIETLSSLASRLVKCDI